jgi:hypothetical protein
MESIEALNYPRRIYMCPLQTNRLSLVTIGLDTIRRRSTIVGRYRYVTFPRIYQPQSVSRAHVHAIADDASVGTARCSIDESATESLFERKVNIGMSLVERF